MLCSKHHGNLTLRKNYMAIHNPHVHAMLIKVGQNLAGIRYHSGSGAPQLYQLFILLMLFKFGS